MYKLPTSARCHENLSIDPAREIIAPAPDCFTRKNTHVHYLWRISTKDVSDYAEYQEQSANGLGYQFTLRRKSAKVVLSRNGGTVIGKKEI